jgi:hypothetical protein
MAFADCNVIAVPCDRTLHDLPVHACVAAEWVALSPLFEVEEVAEKPKDLCLVEQTQSQRAAEMGLKNGRGFFKIGQHPRSVDGVLLRLALERFGLQRLQREAPVKINAAECRILAEKVQPIGCENHR